MLDLKNTFEGKFIAVFMSVVLVMSMTNILAFAGNEVEQAPADEAATEQSVTASDQEVDASDEQAVSEAMQHGADAAASDASDAGAPAVTASEPLAAAPSEPIATTAVDEAVVTFELENAYASVKDQVLSGKTLTTELHKELRFSASADTGFELESITAENAANADVPVTTQDGISIIAAEYVDSTLVVTVTAKAVATDEPAVETEPITSDTKVDSTEGVAEEGDGQAVEDEKTATDDAAEADEPAADEAVDNDAPAAKESSSPAAELYAQVDNVLVKVTADEGVLPAGATVAASRVQRSDVIDAVSSAIGGEGRLLQDAVAIDVTLLDEQGNAIQPNGAVNVCFFDAAIDGGEVGVYHVSDDAASVEPVPARQADANVQSFDVEHFSIYVVAGDDEKLEIPETGKLVIVNYVYPSGHTARDSYSEAIQADDQGKMPFSYKVETPFGYAASVSEGSGFALDEDGMLTADVAEGEDKTVSVTVTFTPEKVEYSVVHKYPRLEGVEDEISYDATAGQTLETAGEFYLLRETVIGDFGDATDASEHAQEGFSKESVTNVVIDAEEGIEATVDYVRNPFSIQYETNGGSYVKATDVVFGQTVELPSLEKSTAPLREGYKFAGWYDNAELSGEPMAQADSVTENMMLYAKWEPAEVSYRIAFWTENANDENYSNVGSIQRTALAEASVKQEVSEDDVKSAFSEKMGEDAYGRLESDYYTFKSIGNEAAADAETISPDGSTVVNVYFDRNVYTLLFKYGEYTKDGKQFYVWLNTTGWSTGNFDQVNSDDIKTLSNVANAPKDIVVEAKYGADIQEKWPELFQGVRAKQQFVSWGVYFKSPFASANQGAGTAKYNIKGAYSTMSAALIVDPGQPSVVHELHAFWAEKNVKTYSYDYYVEVIDGNTDDAIAFTSSVTGEKKYYRYDHSDLTRSTADVDGQTVVELPHLVSVSKPSEGGPYYKEGNTTHIKYYYDREECTVYYHNGASEERDTLLYGSDLAESGKRLDPESCPNKLAGSTKDWTFEGWYLDEAGTEPMDWQDAQIESNITVYAKWTPPSYTISADLNYEGADAIDSKQVSEGGTVSFDTPVRDGFVFGGWYADAACTEEFDINAPVVEDAEIYAKWNEVKYVAYTVKYQYENGDDADDPDTGTGLVGSTVTAKPKDVDGYVVDKSSASLVLDHNADANEIVFTYTKPASFEYRVQYGYEGDDGNLYVLAYENKDGELLLEAPSDEEAAGSWRTNKVSAISVTPFSTILERLPGYRLLDAFKQVKLVANSDDNVITFMLDPIKYDISYVDNGANGWGLGGSAENPNPSTYSVNSENFALVNPVKAGYTFTGWKVSATNPESGDVTVNGEAAMDQEEPNDKVLIETGSRGNLTFTATWAPDLSDLTAKGFEVTYDGTAHKVTLGGTVLPTDTIEYWVGETKLGANEFIDVADSAEVVVKVIRDGVTRAIDPVTAKITPAKVKVAAEDKSKKYGEADPDLTLGSPSSPVAPEKPAFSGTLVRASGEDVGKYAIERGSVELADDETSGFKASNYTLEVDPGLFTITPASLDPEGSVGIQVNNPSDVQYNGGEQTWTPSVLDKNNHELKADVDYTVSYSEDVTNVGVVTVTITGIGNYEGTVERTYNITPAPAVIHVNDAFKFFNTDDPAFSGAVDGLVAKDSLGDVIYSRTNGDEAVGEYEGVLTASVDNLNPNYTYTVVPGSFTIKPADGNVVNAEGLTKTYDGKPASAKAEAGQPGSTLLYSLDGEEWSEQSPSFTDAGIYAVYVKATNPNYEDTSVVSANIVINRAPVVITVNDASKEFGSDDPSFSGTVEGLVAEGDLGEVVYVRANADENVSSYAGVLTATYDKNRNYEVKVVNGSFAITPRAIDADVPTDVVYSGKEQKWAPTVTDPDGNALVEGADYTVSYSADATNVGTVVVTIEGKGNYAGTVERTYNITPAPAVIHVNDASKLFNTADPAFSGAVEGLLGTDSLGDVIYSRTNGDEAVGEYEGVLTASVDNLNPNYTYSVEPGNFAIEPADGNVVNAEGLTKTYDGKPASAKAEAGQPGSTLLYSLDGEEWSSDNPSFTDAGAYTVYAKATNPNFEETPVVTANVVIKQAPVTIRVNDASKAFGEADPAFSGAVEGLVGEDSLGDVAYERANDVEDAGTYPGVLGATVGNLNPNYTYTVVPGDFTIVPAGGNLVNAEGLTKTYDGQPASATAEAGQPGSTLLYSLDGRTWSETNPSFTDAGAYTVYAMATNPNYEDTAVVTANVVVNPAPATVTVNPASKVFGEVDPTFSGTVEGLVAEGDLGEVAYVRTNADESVGSYAGVLTATYGKNRNYEVTVHSGAFTITPQTIAANDPLDKVYSGQEQKWAPTVTDPDGNVLVEGADYTVSYSGDVTNVGVVTVTITGIGNYAGTVERSYEITPAAAVVRVNDASKAFGEADPAFSGAVEGLVGEDSLGDVAYERANDVEDAGTYPGVLGATVGNLNPNYTYTVVPGSFTIVPAGSNIVNAEGLTKTYDGQPASATAAAGQPGSTLLYSLDGEEWSSDNPSFTDAGAYTVYAMATNPNYEDTAVVTANVVVNPAPATVTVADATKVFGSDDPAFSGAVDGLVADDDLGEVSYVRAGGAEDVGVYAGALTALYAPNANYKVTVSNGTFAITPRAIDADVPTDVVYSGQEQKWAPTVTDPDGNALVEGADYTVSYSADATNVGSVSVTIEGKGNYAGTVERAYNITPAPAVIRVNDASKLFNANDPVFSGSIEGLFGTDSLGDVIYSRTNSDEAVGSYEGVLTAAIDNLNPNYTYTVEPGSFAIEPADGNIVRIATDADGLVKTYDGQPSSIAAGADVDGSTLLYSVDGENWSEENPTFTNAGAYTVYVKATHPGYEETAAVSATIVINKAPVTIAVADGSKIAGTADPAFTGTIEGLVVDDDLGTVSYVRSNGVEEAGVYADVLTALYTLNDNYAVTVIPGTFTITAATSPTPATPVTPTPTTPTPATPTPTPLPTPGTPPANNPITPIIAPVVDALATAAETVIGDNATPLAQSTEPRETEIGDNETPLAGVHAWCWVHWYIILGIIVTAVYAACVALRRGLFSRKLKKYEDDLTGGGDPAPGAPSTDGDVAAPVMPKGVPAGATLAAGLGE